MAFSVGVLYSIQSFLKFIQEVEIRASDFPNMFTGYHFTPPKYILETALMCRWITVRSDDILRLTALGEEVVKYETIEERLRIQIRHMIESSKPSWSALLFHGRSEAEKYFPSEVRQCFKEAGLLDGSDDDIIKWWDTLAVIARGRQNVALLEIGRLGERLSIEFEIERTQKKPFWQSIESNFSGYDIISVVSSEDSCPLMIEVKASERRGSEVAFHITQNEWDVALNSKNYIFHFWLLQPKPKLFRLSVEQVSEHIPINKGKGTWESVKIDFICVDN